MAARLDKEQNGVMIRKALNHLPNEPLYALLGALEHVELQEHREKSMICLLCRVRQEDS